MSSRESSFDALAYYKGLTKQLSNKRNQFDVKKIPNNFNQVRKNQKIKLITKQQLMDKAFSKYKTVNNTDQQKQTQQQSQNQHQQQKQKIQFKEHIIERQKVLKHQKHEDTYINLPKSFFESFNGPNISLFKKPEFPTSSVARVVIKPKVLDKTFQSIFSAFSFKPPITSTPIEKTTFVPLISDPEEIYSEMNSFRVTEKRSDKSQFATFMSLVDSAARKMDIKGFSQIKDQVKVIKFRIKEMYEDSRRYPNEDKLNGSGSTASFTPARILDSPDSIFLKPSTVKNTDKIQDIYFLSQNQKSLDMLVKKSIINHNSTAKLFESPVINNQNSNFLKFDSPLVFDHSFLDSPFMSQLKFSPNLLFNSPRTPSNLFMDEPDFANNSMLLNTQKIFEDTSDKMEWENNSWLKNDNDLVKTIFFNCLSDIFYLNFFFRTSQKTLLLYLVHHRKVLKRRKLYVEYHRNKTEKRISMEQDIISCKKHLTDIAAFRLINGHLISSHSLLTTKPTNKSSLY